MAKNLAIIRPDSQPLNLDKYNVQEIGLGKELVNKGWNVDFFLCGKVEKKELIFKNCDASMHVFFLKGIRILRHLTYYPTLSKLLSQKHYDLVQVNDDSNLTSVLVVNWAKSKKVPVVLYQGMYQAYSGIKGILQRIFNIWALPYYQRYLTYSLAKTTSASKYLQSLLISPVEILRVGLDISRFKTPIIQHKDKNLLLFSKQFESIMLYIGSLDQRRNGVFIISLLNRLCEDSNIGLVLIGDGPEKDGVERHIVSLGLKDRVYYLKSVPNESIAQYFQEADFFVLPSDHEIFGMVVLESLYFMVPVIAKNTPGPSDIIKNAAHGMILTTLDLEQWSHACRKYMGNKSNRKVELRDYVMLNYNWAHAAESYVSFYEKYCT